MKPSLKISIKIWFELEASDPPFKITAFPDFKASEEIWIFTSGLASKITQITPIGQVILYIFKPSSNSVPEEIWPKI